MGIRQNEQKINLLSMTDFVLEQTKINQFRDDCEFAYPVRKYANFLKQPLELWMFVPCDENGNVLEQCDDICSCECDKIKAFRKAKERCLFVRQDEYDYTGICEMFTDLEDIIKFGFELTEIAIKESGI